MEIEVDEVRLTEFKKFKHTSLYWITDNPNVALIRANATYIPIEDFKSAFIAMEELVRNQKIKRLIFDKRALRVFHQPSMEWYFIEWKEKMADLGLTTHVKILPDDVVFCQSVKIGRQQIDQKYPNARFHKLNIQYAVTLTEAAADY
jgi:hypothetical protein